MKAEKSSFWSDRIHFSDSPLFLPVVAYGDEIEVGNGTYSITEVEEMIAVLQTAVMVARCYENEETKQ